MISALFMVVIIPTNAYFVRTITRALLNRPPDPDPMLIGAVALSVWIL
jgi:hypothetical protein